jgi:hypothetical protein
MPNESFVEPAATGHHIVSHGTHAADHASTASHVNACDAAASERHFTSTNDATLLP